MLKKILLVFFLTGFYSIQAKTNMTFTVNMQPLIEKNLFRINSQEIVVVRGNFNEWSGNDYQLVIQNDSNLYGGTFEIVANSGDTLEYKFVIIRSNGKAYWERNPNPSNKNYGNRMITITGENLILPPAKFHYDEYIQYPVLFSQQKLQADFIQMKEVLEEIHPALYDYSSKKIMDSLFNKGFRQIHSEMPLNEFYKICSGVLSQIGCGHTKLWIPDDYWNIVPDKLFPLKLLMRQNKVYLAGFFTGDTLIPTGSEIISINNLMMTEIIDSLKSVSSSDGFIESFKIKNIENNFSRKYALFFGYPESFRIDYLVPSESLVKKENISPCDIDELISYQIRPKELSLKVLPDLNSVIITINTFGYYDQREMFRSFIDSSFQTVKHEKIGNLILDLRGNDGGDPYCSSYLLSYIASQLVPYFRKPYGDDESLSKPIPLAANHFTGNIFTLVDGGVFSTTGHLTALLKYHQIGKLVGSETGATFTCTGSVEYINLANTRLILGTARHRRYSVVVERMDPMRGVLPDYYVDQTQDDIIHKKDTVLNYVMNMIQDNEEN
jgi:hypothetical protein